VEKYYKPCVMLTDMDGLAKGSARSISHFNIYESLRECEDMLVHFGGHEAAAGLAMELSDVEPFRERFNKIVARRMEDAIASPPIEIDAMLRFADITPKFMRILEQFSPFGPGNMRPVLCATDVRAGGSARAVGSNGKHLMLTVTQDGTDKVFDAVGFDFGEYAEKLNNGCESFDMIFGIDQKIKDGKIYPQIRIRELKLK
jgi:single-stranded-DNA-specific exonuclease